MSLNSQLIRRTFRSGDEKRDAGLTTPADVRRFDDIPYGDDPVWQALDVYRPAAAGDDPLPVIVSVHGGAWVYGDKQLYQYYCMALAQRGFGVVNFSYRLAPEHKFPASLTDTDAVFAWVKAHGAEYGLNTEQLFAVGDSAGAHLLGLYCAWHTNPAMPEALADAGLPLPDRRGMLPRAIALNCGTYDLAARKQMNPANMSLIMADLLPAGHREEKQQAISVTPYLTEHFPPVYLMTAQGDFLKAQAIPFAQALSQAEVLFTLRYWKGSEGELGHVFHLNQHLREAHRCNDAECAWFREFL